MIARRGQLKPSATAASIRVAVYTRQSIADQKEFGSIEAQREAIEAYVASQKAEGWIALPERYDDGGFTGANTERPAFQRLLADVAAGKVDVIAVYKIDRLSRSLLDFGRIMETLDHHGVTFVSVTQQFSTATPMGKFTLNILMSFAEFERETIAERTRDKVLATRRRGLWTGGRPVLGYDVVEKKLVVNESEAATVRTIFATYRERGSLLACLGELRNRGIRNKSFLAKSGKQHLGTAFDKTSLHHLLRSPIYAGLLRCGDELATGQHAAIIDRATWESVQAQLKQRRRDGGASTRNKHGAILRGLLACGRCGASMIHQFTRRGTKVYRFYVCSTAEKNGAESCPGSRAPAAELEAFVFDKIRAIGRNPKVIAETLAAARKDRTARKPELVAEARRLGQERQTVAVRRQRLLDAVSESDTTAGPILEQVAELDRQLTTVQHRQQQVTDELADCERPVIDEAALRKALGEFDPLWDALVTAEKVRLLQLLIELVTFDASTGELAITFRAPGVEALVAANGSATP